MARYRLLHASDLHFARRPHQIGLPDLRHAWAARVQGPFAPVSSQGTIYADAFAAFAQANAAALDAILVSGDLATTGSPGDLGAARRFLFSPVAQGYLNARQRPTLQAANLPTLLLPGNHDRFRNLNLPGGKHFDRLFGTRWRVGQGAQLMWSLPRGGTTLTLLGADFSLAPLDLGGRWLGIPSLGYLGRGRVYRRRLNILVALTNLARAQNPRGAVIWVLHFEPGAADASLALLDEQRLLGALQGCPVDAILCGHTHASAQKHFGGTPVFVCGTTTQHASQSGNELQVIDINVPALGAPQVTCQVYRYNPASAAFV